KMKPFIVKICAGIFLLSAAYICMLYYIAPTHIESHYPSYSDVVADKDPNVNWALDILPKSAENIYLQYGVDPPFQMLEFNFSPVELALLTQNFSRVTNEEKAQNINKNVRQMRWQRKMPTDTS